MHTTPSLEALIGRGFYPDLVKSMQGFMEFMHEKKFCREGQEIVETLAFGFLRTKEFSASDFVPKLDDPFGALKVNYLRAVERIFLKFGDRLPAQFYETLAFMALREDPTQEERIPEIEHLLPNGMDWMTADSMLHAMPLCSRLYFHVQTIINERTGRILGHGCGCSCSIAEMPICIVKAKMGNSPEILAEETESFLRHTLGQLFLLRFGLPQGMGPSYKMDFADLKKGLRDFEQVVLKQGHH